jgi:hypothetical protein
MTRAIALLIVSVMCLAVQPAYADQATVKEVARNNNCPPKKIEVYQQSLGPEGETVYRVECNLPKMVGDQSPGSAANALLIGCHDSLCELLRPVEEQKK